MSDPYSHPVYRAAKQAMLGLPCHMCGGPGSTTVDHVIPLSQGGSNTIDNMAPAHASCNYRAGALLSHKTRRGKRRERNTRYQ